MTQKPLVILLAAISLTACHHGNVSSETPSLQEKQNDSQELVKNPRILNLLDQKQQGKLKTLSPSEVKKIISTNKSVRLGDGYDPDTHSIALISLNLADFNYGPAEKRITPLRLDACTYVDYASELGEVKSTSTSETMGGSLGGAANIGLATIKIAGKIDTAKQHDDGSLNIKKIFGASIKCNVMTFADPSINTKGGAASNYAHVAEAMLKGSPDIRNRIKKIRVATTLASRQKEIKDFYAEFGTYMVSGVTLGKVAVKEMELTQKTATDISSLSLATKASFSYPFFSAEASFDMARAEKVDSKNWKAEMVSGSYPAQNSLVAIVDGLEEKLSKMTASGIIDMGGLKPTPVDVPKDFVAPAYPDMTQMDAVAIQIKELHTAIITMAYDIGQVGEIADAIIDEPTNAEAYVDVLAILTKLKAEKVKVESDIELLSSDDLKKFQTEVGPIVKAWATYPSLDSSFTTSKNKVDKGEVPDPATIAKIQAKLAKGGTDSSAAKTAEEVQEAKDKAAEKDKLANGVNFGKWLLKDCLLLRSNDSDYAKRYVAAKSSEEKDEIYKSWYQYLLQSNKDQLTKWKAEWDAKHKPADSKLAQYILKSQVTKMSLKEGEYTEAEAKVYGDNGVLNFNVTPWSKLFPELTQSFAIDDGLEVNENALIAAINKFNQKYHYLSKMVILDDSLSSFYTKTKIVYSDLNRDVIGIKPILEKALLNQENPNVDINGTTYDLNDIESVAKLIKLIDDKTAEFETANWTKITSKLIELNLLSTFGSLLSATDSPEPGNAAFLISFYVPRVGDTRGYIPKQGERINRGAPHIYLPNANYRKNQDFKNGYTTFNNSIASLVVKPLPQSYAEIYGAIPAVTSKTTLENNSISNLAIVDSSGQLLSAGVDTVNNSQTITSTTTYYRLDTKSNHGRDGETPSYSLQVMDGNSLIRCGFPSVSGDEDAVIGLGTNTEKNCKTTDNTSLKLMLTPIDYSTLGLIANYVYHNKNIQPFLPTYSYLTHY